jgi:deoxyribodipyrimidine photo-lyase
MSEEISIFWFRRDLRTDDNVGFLEALKGQDPVLPIFIFDTEILDKLPENDARVTFIHDSLQKIRKELQANGSSLAIYHGKPLEIFKQLIKDYKVAKVYTNRDYEPYAMERDEEIDKFLISEEVPFHTFKDQVIFEKDEIVKKDGDPYVVYTPYMKLWKENFRKKDPEIHYTNQYLKNLVQNKRLPNLSLSDINFERSSIPIPNYDVSPTLIAEYEARRNFPAIDATSRLGVHLRFGTVGIRKIIKKAASEKNETFLQELIWREFFMQILYHYPHTVTEAFKSKYDRIEWRNNEEEFEEMERGKNRLPFGRCGNAPVE